MILLITKYHRTAAGETAASETVRKDTEVECYREAYKKAAQYEANYYADSSVIDFCVSVVDPRMARVVKHSEYFSTVAEPTE